MDTLDPDSEYFQNLDTIDTSSHDHGYEMKIAHLLLDARIISPNELEDALTLCLQYHQALTTVLDIKHQFPPDTLRNARHAQEMIEALEIDMKTAANALRMSFTAGLPFDYVLARTERASENDNFSDLEAILLESGVVSETTLREVKGINRDQNLPISSSLLLLKSVQFSHLNYACECLYLLQEGLISKTVAIRALRLIREENVDLRTALEMQGSMASMSLSRIRLGDLLVQGKVVSESDMLGKIEESLTTRRLVGSLLVESGLIDEDMLIDALILQAFCTKEILDKHSTIKLLRKSLESGQELAATARTFKVLADDEQTAGGAIELLKKARLVSADDIDQAQARFYNYGMGTLKGLVASGFLAPWTRRAAIECAYLTSNNLLTEAEAVYVLRCCKESGNQFEDTLSKLPLARAQEEQRQLETKITNQFLQVRVYAKPKFHESVECLWLMVIAALTMIAGGLMMSNPDLCAGGFGYLLVALCSAIAALNVALRWNRAVKHHLIEHEAKAQTAAETVKRLSSSKRKLA